MDTSANENQFLAARVLELEQEITRMRRLGIIAAGLLLLLLVGFRIEDHRRFTTDEVVARDIVVNDTDGHQRARMSVFPEGSGVEVFASSGERRAELLGRGQEAMLNLYTPVTAVNETAAVNLFHDNVLRSSFQTNSAGGRLEMHSEKENGSALMSLQGTTALLMLSGAADGVPKIWLSADKSQACTALGGASESGESLCLHAPGLPSLEMADVVGNRAVMGIPSNPDLATDKDSAASLVLRHKSGKKVQVTPQ